MAGWADFERDSPQMAETGRALLYHFGPSLAGVSRNRAAGRRTSHPPDLSRPESRLALRLHHAVAQAPRPAPQRAIRPPFLPPTGGRRRVLRERARHPGTRSGAHRTDLSGSGPSGTGDSLDSEKTIATRLPSCALLSQFCARDSGRVLAGAAVPQCGLRASTPSPDPSKQLAIWESSAPSCCPRI